jgi:hypothetical protein
MLVVTELHEGRDGADGTGEDPLPEELADTAIRLLDILGAIWGHEWSYRESASTQPTNLFQAIETLLWKPLGYLCMAAESWRFNNRIDTRIALEIALREVMWLGEAIGSNMLEEIAAKVNRNAKRGHLHGKKRPDG